MKPRALIIRLDMSGDAFQCDDWNVALALEIREIANRIETSHHWTQEDLATVGFVVRDPNGNTCGAAIVHAKEDKGEGS